MMAMDQRQHLLPLGLNQPTPSLRPFFKYYGGKWRDATKHYPRPKHNTIVEPFAGSAGYSLRYPDRDVILCEVSPILAAVWGYLLGASRRDILALPDLQMNETVDDLQICQEARWLVGLWLNAGASSPRKRPSRWMRERKRPGSFWGERVRNTIANQLQFIRHWKVIQGDYERCEVRGKATWFVDPPYQEAGKHYRHGSSSINYERLAEWCVSRPGQVIVCEAYGADWLPFGLIADVKTTRKGKRSTEVVWCRE